MTGSAGAMIGRRAAAIIAPLLLLMVAGCSDDPAAPQAPASPLLYEIASSDGTVEGWMFGTIHALPDGTAWRTPAVTEVIESAGLLVVEIAALDDDAALSRTFAALASTPGLPSLSQRIPAELRPSLDDLLARGGLVQDGFADTETWAAAITLARIDATGDPANGVDRALIADFASRRVREFEGVGAQLAIFDRLPEPTQRNMLAAVVRGSQSVRRDPERLQRAWLAGDVAAIEASTREGILADPPLRQALLESRNRRWVAALVPLLREAPRPLVAVGAAHLLGPEGLAALIEAQGYRLRRIKTAAPASP